MNNLGGDGMKKYIGWVPIIAILWTIFQLYIASMSPLIAQLQRSIHLAFALALTFALLRRGEKSSNIIIRHLDHVLIILSLSSCVYVYTQIERLTSRIQFAGELLPLDYFYGILVILLTLEASRRAVGKAMSILASVFIIYAFSGPYMPGLLRHDSFDLKKMVEVMYYSNEGILGSPLQVSVDYVFYFILFAAFLDISGAGKAFIDVAFRLTGKSKGGPAKASVIASGGMGSISGSSVANVVTTGILTIPLMKKVGFSPKFSASVEALASNGGQLLPPIMGAAAFIMANNLGLTYAKVAIAATIPAFLYFVAIFTMVHIMSNKLGLRGLKDDEFKEVIKDDLKSRIHLLIPLIALVVMIIAEITLQRAALYSLILLVIISYFRKNTRMSFKDVIDGCINGAKQSIQVAMPCAVAGIIVGIVVFSGLGLKFTSLIINWSFGIPAIAVILVAIACIILGMGMPTTSAYIMAAVLLSPALQNLGFSMHASHMFILYFAVFSMITPPVAIATYSAATIAKSNPHETGFYAFYLGIPGFLIGLSLLVNPSLLLNAPLFDVIWSTTATLIGVIALSISVLGYLYTNINAVYRILFLMVSIMLIMPNMYTDIFGLLFLIILVSADFIKKKQLHGKSITTAV